jgi:hypothetical protein
VTSGYMHPPPKALPERCVFLPKPYKPEEVVEAFRRLAA